MTCNENTVEMKSAFVCEKAKYFIIPQNLSIQNKMF